MLAHIHRHGCTCTDTNRHAKSADRPTPSHMRRPAYTHTHTHSKALWEGWGGRWGKHGCMFMCTICICIQSVCVCVSEGLAVTPVEVACRHAVCVYGVCAACRSIICATVLQYWGFHLEGVCLIVLWVWWWRAGWGCWPPAPRRWGNTRWQRQRFPEPARPHPGCSTHHEPYWGEEKRVRKKGIERKNEARRENTVVSKQLRESRISGYFSVSFDHLLWHIWVFILCFVNIYTHTHTHTHTHKHTLYLLFCTASRRTSSDRL